jgi:hypothetical protein
MEASASEQALSQLQRNRLDSGTSIPESLAPIQSFWHAAEELFVTTGAPSCRTLKQRAQQSVNRKNPRLRSKSPLQPRISRFTVYGSAALLTDRSLCKDRFGSSTHLVDDLTGKEQTYAAQD